MGSWLTMARREAGALFRSPAALFTAAFFALMYGFAFHLGTATNPVAAFDDLALFVAYLSLLLAPLVTMRAFAEETASGSLELLLTAPVRPVTVVLAKFAGTYLFFLASIAPCAVFALLLGWAGRLDWGATGGAFLGLALTGALFVAAGLLASSLTASTVAAAAAACGGLLFLLLLEEFDPASGPGSAFAHAFGFVARLRRMISGEIAERDLLYFVLFAGGLLFLAWLALDGRGGIGKLRKARRRGWLLAAGWAWLASAVLVVLGVAWLHVAGLLDPVAWRMAVRMDQTAFLGWSLTPAAAGLVCFAVGVFCYCRAGRAAESPVDPDPSGVPGAPAPVAAAPERRRRKATVLGVAALTLVAVQGYWLSGRPWRRAAEATGVKPLAWLEARSWDWSGDGRNTLPPELSKVVARVSEPLTVRVFFSQDSNYRDVPLPLLTRQLMDRCIVRNPLIRAQYIDPARDPDRAAAAAAELGIDLAYIDQAMALEYEGRKQIVVAGQLLKAPPPEARLAAGDAAAYEFAGETRLATTLLQLIDPRVTRVGFLQGRGEASITGEGSGRTTAKLFTLLRQLGLAPRAVTIGAGEAVPHDCDVLVMAGTRRPIEAEVVAALDGWLKNGGRLFYLPAPAARRGGEGDDDVADEVGRPFSRLLRNWGGTPRQDQLRDPQQCEDGQATLPLATYAPALRGGGARVVAVLPLARTFRDFPGADGWRPEPYLVSSPTSLALSSDPRQPLREGPFTVAYRSTRRNDGSRPEGRVAVLGSLDAAANSGIGRAQNQELALGMLLWLAGRDELLEVAERPWVDRSLKVSVVQGRVFGWVAFGLIPLAWCAAGAFAWWTRRQ